jgi:hypothetical protein
MMRGIPDGETKSFDGVDGSQQLRIGEATGTHEASLLGLVGVENDEFDVVLVVTRAALLLALSFLESGQHLFLKLFTHTASLYYKNGQVSAIWSSVIVD